MPRVTCVDCGKFFMASRSTKKHCGCIWCTTLTMIIKKPPYEKIIKEPVVKAKKKKYNKSRQQRYEAKKAIKSFGIIKELCEECGSTGYLAVHHVDKNKANNERSNLKVLCLVCHRLKHPELSDFFFKER